MTYMTTYDVSSNTCFCDEEATNSESGGKDACARRWKNSQFTSSLAQ